MAIARTPQYFTGTIAAHTSKGIDAEFRKWFIVSATGVLGVKTNFTPKQIFSERSGEEAEGDLLYSRIELFNDTAADIDITLFYGFGNFIDRRNENQGAVTVTASALPAGGATSAKQDTLIAKDFATQTTLAAVLAKIIAAPATEATLAAASAKLPAVLDGAGRLKIGANTVGALGNAWNAAAVLAAGVSAAVDTLDAAFASAFGNVDAATTLTLQVSQDNAAFYDTAANIVLAGAGDFHLSLSTGAKYIRLKSSAPATITATIAAKG
jgi:hypothetical protein